MIAGDAVYVGTDNARQLNPLSGSIRVLMAFRCGWQVPLARPGPRVERGLGFLLPSTTSAPYGGGERLVLCHRRVPAP